MNLRGLQQGDLAKCLRRVAEVQDAPQAAGAQIPAVFIEHLLLLRCIERGADGALRITEKGRLALHMERPDALHR